MERWKCRTRWLCRTDHELRVIMCILLPFAPMCCRWFLLEMGERGVTGGPGWCRHHNPSKLSYQGAFPILSIVRPSLGVLVTRKLQDELVIVWFLTWSFKLCFTRGKECVGGIEKWLSYLVEMLGSDKTLEWIVYPCCSHFEKTHIFDDRLRQMAGWGWCRCTRGTSFLILGEFHKESHTDK